MRKLAFTLVLSLLSVAASAQIKPCTINKSGDPVCDQAAFRQAFADAQYVSYNDNSLDRVTSKQLHDLLTSFGKQIVSDDDHPGLVFVLTHPDVNGVFVGPSGVVIARLRVYGPGGRVLLWEEIYQDQPDVPFPSAVLYLLQNFRDRLTHRLPASKRGSP